MQLGIAKCYSFVNSSLLIRPRIADCYDLAMAGVKEIRRAKLQALFGSFESQKAFAEAAGLVPSHVSQMNTGAREMGDEVARRIEENLDLRAGWMDDPSDMDTSNLLTQEERDLLAAYRASRPDARVVVWDVLDGELRRSVPELADKLGPRNVAYQESAHANLVEHDKRIRLENIKSTPLTRAKKKGGRDAKK